MSCLNLVKVTFYVCYSGFKDIKVFCIESMLPDRWLWHISFRFIRAFSIAASRCGIDNRLFRAHTRAFPFFDFGITFSCHRVYSFIDCKVKCF